MKGMDLEPSKQLGRYLTNRYFGTSVLRVTPDFSLEQASSFSLEKLFFGLFKAVSFLYIDPVVNTDRFSDNPLGFFRG